MCLVSPAFLNQNQNTVYLRCSSPELSQVWYKPNYPYNPHLTLYDGNDRGFANDLLAGLSSCTKRFTVNARGVDCMVSIKGERVLPTTRLSIELACEHLKIDVNNYVSQSNHLGIRIDPILRVYNALQNSCTKSDSTVFVSIHHLVQSELPHLHNISTEHLYGQSLTQSSRD